MSTIRVERLRLGLDGDFDHVHSDANGAGWCRCGAWWVPTWDRWGERTASENAALRAELCRRGEYDGLLAYDGGDPVGWCQVGPRDRLAKLVRHFELEASPETWAATCFLVAPRARGRRVARALLRGAIETAGAEGGTRLEGYPRIGADEPGDLWTGPEGLFRGAGLAPVRNAPPRRIYALQLAR